MRGQEEGRWLPAPSLPKDHQGSPTAAQLSPRCRSCWPHGQAEIPKQGPQPHLPLCFPSMWGHFARRPSAPQSQEPPPCFQEHDLPLCYLGTKGQSKYDAFPLSDNHRATGLFSLETLLG